MSATAPGTMTVWVLTVEWKERLDGDPIGQTVWVYSQDQHEAAKKHFHRVNDVVQSADGYHVAQCQLYNVTVNDELSTQAPENRSVN